MSELIPQMIDSPPAEKPFSAIWAVSLLFWCTLLVAALLYGFVALAPRLFAWIENRQAFITNAHQLQALETEVDYLERVRDALESDPDFVRRLANAATDENLDETEIIPVSGSLIFGGEDQLQDRLPVIEAPVGAELIQRFANDHQLRYAVMVSAGLLVIFAFTVLNGPAERFVSLVSRLAVATAHGTLTRYRRADPPERAVPTELQPGPPDAALSVSTAPDDDCRT